jgi:Holliday junction DNA helicase RuvA
MISSLSGRVLEIDKDGLMVGLGGVGLQVFIPAPLLESLRPGEDIFLYTHLVVREDLLALYGFESKDEREIFLQLIQVSGIGPKLALAVLSTLEPDAIRRAVFHEQPEVFNRVPGVGRKTAQKIYLHLQDRIPALDGLQRAAPVSEVDTEVLAALTTLGYSVVEAQSALQSISSETPQEVESRLREALKYFS